MNYETREQQQQLKYVAVKIKDSFNANDEGRMGEKSTESTKWNQWNHELGEQQVSEQTSKQAKKEKKTNEEKIVHQEQKHRSTRIVLSQSLKCLGIICASEAAFYWRKKETDG